MFCKSVSVTTEGRFVFRKIYVSLHISFFWLLQQSQKFIAGELEKSGTVDKLPEVMRSFYIPLASSRRGPSTLLPSSYLPLIRPVSKVTKNREPMRIGAITMTYCLPPDLSWFFTAGILPRRWTWHVPPKCLFKYELHCHISQNIATIVTTAVRAWNPAKPPGHFQLSVLSARK